MLPPGPDEAGPSNWIERNAEIAHIQSFGCSYNEQQSDNLYGEYMATEPQEFRPHENITNDRFRLSPPPLADPFNPILQEPILADSEENGSTSADNYSPSSPLEISFSSSDDSGSQVDYGSQVSIEEDMPHRPVVLALPITSAMFSGKTRCKGQLTRAISVESSMRVSAEQEQTKMMRRKKHYEEWDAKGGFSLRIDGAKDGTVDKSITDASMARALGVCYRSYDNFSVNEKESSVYFTNGVLWGLEFEKE